MEQYEGVRDLNSLVEFVTLMKSRAAGSPTPPIEQVEDVEEAPEATAIKLLEDFHKGLVEHRDNVPEPVSVPHLLICCLAIHATLCYLDHLYVI